MKTGNELVCIGLQGRKLSIAMYFDYSEIVKEWPSYFIPKNNDLVFIVLKLKIRF